MAKKIIRRNSLGIAMITFLFMATVGIFLYKLDTITTNKIVQLPIEQQASVPQTSVLKDLRVGMLRSLSTLYIDYRSPNQIGGFDYALLTKFADSLDLKLHIVFANSIPELIEKVNSGQINFIASELPTQSLVKNNFLMSEPYHYFSQLLIYKKGSVRPTTFDELDGALVIPKNSLQSFILKNIQAKYDDLSWQENPFLNQEDLLKLVVDQKIDYTIADDRTVSLMRRIYPSISIAFSIVDKQPSAWYFPTTKNNTLLTKANLFIKTSLQDGSIKKLEYRYFNHINDFDYVDTREFIRAINKSLPIYRQLFEENAKKHSLDWKLIAAMAYQESHWNPTAVSPTGVKGMMMLTKLTAASLGVTNRLNAEQSIKGGSTYLKKLIDRLPSSISKEDRIWFALAAYNMGYGHLLDARKLAVALQKNPDSWQDMRQILPLLSKEEYYSNLKYGYARGYQAVDFVNNIQQYYLSLVGYLLENEWRQKNIDAKIQQSLVGTQTEGL